MGDYIEVWSSQATDTPFVSQEEFTASLAKLMEEPSNSQQ